MITYKIKLNIWRAKRSLIRTISTSTNGFRSKPCCHRNKSRLWWNSGLTSPVGTRMEEWGYSNAIFAIWLSFCFPLWVEITWKCQREVAKHSEGRLCSHSANEYQRINTAHKISRQIMKAPSWFISFLRELRQQIDRGVKVCTVLQLRWGISCTFL